MIVLVILGVVVLYLLIGFLTVLAIMWRWDGPHDLLKVVDNWSGIVVACWPVVWEVGFLLLVCWLGMRLGLVAEVLARKVLRTWHGPGIRDPTLNNDDDDDQ